MLAYQFLIQALAKFQYERERAGKRLVLFQQISDRGEYANYFIALEPRKLREGSGSGRLGCFRELDPVSLVLYK